MKKNTPNNITLENTSINTNAPNRNPNLNNLIMDSLLNTSNTANSGLNSTINNNINVHETSPIQNNDNITNENRPINDNININTIIGESSRNVVNPIPAVTHSATRRNNSAQAACKLEKMLTNQV